MTTTDFIPGVDFTGLSSAGQSDFNNLVGLAVTFAETDGSGNGKGLVVRSIDTALNTPDVPPAATTTKYKRYIWLRIPHATATVKDPIVYGWNDAATSDTVYLKWIKLIPDTTEFNAALLIIENLANQAITTANNANALATTAKIVADTANTSAVAATTAANNATTAATNATTALTGLNTSITNLTTKVETAQDTADEAKNLAQNQLITNIEVPAGGAAYYGSKIRSNDDNTALEYYKESAMYCVIAEQATAGVSAGATAAGSTYVRDINTIVQGTLVTLSGSKFTFTAKGVYKFHITAIGAASAHVAKLVRDSDNVVISTGTAGYSTGDINSYSTIQCIVTVAANETYRIDHKFGAITAHGLGLAANLGSNERYVLIEITKIV